MAIKSFFQFQRCVNIFQHLKELFQNAKFHIYKSHSPKYVECWSGIFFRLPHTIGMVHALEVAPWEGYWAFSKTNWALFLAHAQVLVHAPVGLSWVGSRMLWAQAQLSLRIRGEDLPASGLHHWSTDHPPKQTRKRTILFLLWQVAHLAKENSHPQILFFLKFWFIHFNLQGRVQNNDR